MRTPVGKVRFAREQRPEGPVQLFRPTVVPLVFFLVRQPAFADLLKLPALTEGIELGA